MAVIAVAIGCLTLSPAGARATASATQALEGANRLYAEGRGLDESANPAFQSAYQAAGDGQWIDPFRRHWSGTRGVMQEVHFTNRYGASLRALMLRPNLPWRDPITGHIARDSLPAIVTVVGLDGAAEDYLSETEQLAEDGYVVLTVEPQGDHLSGADPSPTSTYCGPGGTWRQPQEGGLQESGPCAGQDGPSGPPPMDPRIAALLEPAEGSPVYDPAALAATIASFHTDPTGARDAIASGYDVSRARFTFAAIDAAKWLVSAANPWKDLIDPQRIGVAGHSAGADAAVIAGNADYKHRFKAAVAWDTYGLPPATVAPTVPTMWQQSEQENTFGPWAPLPDPEFWYSYQARHRWEIAGLPTYLVALRGSTHEEWTWGPDPAHMLAQHIAPLYNASAKGGQVAVYYTLAWFDRWLKGPGNPAIVADATRRLTSLTFDASADGTSIGSGTYDPLTNQNVPYTLAGAPVDDHLSRLFRTEYSFDGHGCTDALTGC